MPVGAAIIGELDTDRLGIVFPVSAVPCCIAFIYLQADSIAVDSVMS